MFEEQSKPAALKEPEKKSKNMLDSDDEDDRPRRKLSGDIKGLDGRAIDHNISASGFGDYGKEPPKPAPLSADEKKKKLEALKKKLALPSFVNRHFDKKKEAPVVEKKITVEKVKSPEPQEEEEKKAEPVVQDAQPLDKTSNNDPPTNPAALSI